MKKIISLITAASVTLGSTIMAYVAPVTDALFEPLTVTANAAETQGDFEYSVNYDGKTVTLTEYTGMGGNVEIPTTLGGKSVTSIGDNVFYHCTSLKNITIPDSVTKIGDSAFSGCTALTSVTIPDSVTIIDKRAFDGCSSLTSVTIGNSVTSIGNYAFFGCSSLERVTIPDSVTSIGDIAFFGCSSLESVTIPDGVTSIAYSTFEGCSSLKSVTLPDSVTSIRVDAFYDCSSLESITIPDSVTIIEGDAFAGCSSLTSVTIGKGLTSIGISFSGCSSLEKFEVDAQNEKYFSVDGVLFNKEQTKLICYPAGKDDTSYEIPASVTSIGGYAFNVCSSLESVTIPDSATSIGMSAFAGCSSLKRVTFNGTIAEWNEIQIDNWGNEPLETAEITCTDGVINPRPTDVVEQGTCGDNLTWTLDSEGTLTISGTDDMYDYSYNTALWSGRTDFESVLIEDGVTSIGDYAFSGCSSLTSVTIPSSVTSIGDAAFYRCSSLTSVTIPDSVTSIGDSAFSRCSLLESITIPDSVTSIGYAAFEGCSSLKSVTFNGTMAEWNAIHIDKYNGYLTTAEITCTDGVINPRPTEVTIPVEITKPETNAPNTSDMTVAISGDGVSETLSIGEDGTVEIGDIVDGEYTFTFSANNCAPRAYSVTVASGTLDGLDDGVELHLYGDTNGDGKINGTDVLKAKLLAKGGSTSDAYDRVVANVNKDSTVNGTDVLQLKLHAKGSKNLWQ